MEAETRRLAEHEQRGETYKEIWAQTMAICADEEERLGQALGLREVLRRATAACAAMGSQRRGLTGPPRRKEM